MQDATMKKLTAADRETHSPDLLAENLAALKALFPDLITEGADGVAVNVDVLKALVGDKTVNDGEEKYGLNWHGKRRARQLALTPSTGTLRPCPEESVDWDTTQNLVIEGDNLEVLKLLQKSYAGKVKLIYIDPPYNTGRDFVYPDNFQDSLTNYLQLTGQIQGGQKISSNPETSGRFHTDWLNMMYPRLKLARSLLRSDGALFVTIDDNEAANLKIMLDEIFGEENFVATIAWQKVFAKKNKALISGSHDHIHVYTRNVESWSRNLLPRDEAQLAAFTNPDSDTRGPWQSVAFSVQSEDSERRKEYRYEVALPSGRKVGPPPGRHWNGLPNRYEELLREGRLWFGRDGNNPPRQKVFLSEVQDGIVPDTWWTHDEAGNNQEAKKEVLNLFDDVEPFSTPKPVKLIGRMLQLASTSGEDVILDFFAGSGTTGHSVLKANAADNGRRRFILVQLPEPTGGGGFDTISDVTEERLRLAAKKIRIDNPLFAGDLGFRVFKLDTTNILEWDPDRDKIAETLEASIEHLKTDRTEQDILFELLLKLGLDLCVPIETRRMEGTASQVHDIHSIGGGSLLVCLSQSILQVDVEPLALALASWHEELQPAGDTTVVFRDSAFADDVAKTNITAILQQQGLETVRSL